jgi:hypothetical protein
MKGDRLRCRGCGRYRGVLEKVDDDPDDPDADVTVTPCPTDGCGTTTATLAGGD